MKNFKRNSWFTGLCRICGFQVVVTNNSQIDYLWYCSNHECDNHNKKEETCSGEMPDWVRIPTNENIFENKSNKSNNLHLETGSHNKAPSPPFITSQFNKFHLTLENKLEICKDTYLFDPNKGAKEVAELIRTKKANDIPQIINVLGVKNMLIDFKINDEYISELEFFEALVAAMCKEEIVDNGGWFYDCRSWEKVNEVYVIELDKREKI